MHSGYCIDRSVSYALDREQIVMPKTIFIGLGGAAAACTGRRSYRMILRFVSRELWMMIIPPTSVVRADKAIE